MKETMNNDNIYKEGSIIYAKADPGLTLIIRSYKQPIYYCTPIHEPDHYYAYFEKELIPPPQAAKE